MLRKVMSDRQFRMLKFIFKHSPSGSELDYFTFVTARSLIDRGYIKRSKGQWILTKLGNNVLDQFSSNRVDDMKTKRYGV